MYSRFVFAMIFSTAVMSGASDARDEFRIVRNLLQQAHYEQAANELDAFLNRSDLSPQDRFEAGWLYGQAHQFQKAQTLFRSVSETVPDRVTHAYAAALAAVELQEFEIAVHLLEPISNEPGFGTAHANLLGVAYTRTGQLERAYKVFRNQIEKQPADPTAYFNMSTLLCETGKHAECLAAADQTARDFPLSAQAHLILGAAQVENGQADSSREEFAKAHALDPKSPEAIFFIALSNYRTRKYGPAIELLREATKQGLQDPDLYYLLAECIVQQQEAPETEAFEALNQAISVSPESIPARLLRGKLLLKRHDYGGAAADLEIALKHDPKSRTAIYLLARTYQSLGRNDEAQALRSRIMSPSDDTVERLAGDRVTSLLSRGGVR